MIWATGVGILGIVTLLGSWMILGSAILYPRRPGHIDPAVWAGGLLAISGAAWVTLGAYLAINAIG